MGFVFEICVRFFSFHRKRNSLRGIQSNVDLFLVVLAGMGTWALLFATLTFDIPMYQVPSEALRVLRLTRLTRLARVMRGLPELWALVRGQQLGQWSRML